jgi:hypothetical protein
MLDHVMKRALILFVASMLAACLRTPVGHDISVVSARWHPMSTASGALEIEDSLELLREEEVEALMQHNSLQGVLDVRAYHSTGLGTGSRIILILRKPVLDPVRLPVPDDVTVIYTQEENGWTMIPADAPALDDLSLRLETIVEGKLNGTNAILELPGGGGELVGGIGWGRQP